MNKVSQAARNAVSRDKFRFQDGEYDLDLTYITDRVIAMGYPGGNVEKVWRNDAKAVASFLQRYHPDNYMIFNLSGEPYDKYLFDGRVQEFGFPDHSAPPFRLLVDAVEAILAFLTQNPRHVAVVHCLAGRGRTGTVISAYLLRAGLCHDAQHALGYFASRRSSKGEGVTTPSQIRYVQFYADYVKGRLPPSILAHLADDVKSRPLWITKLLISPGHLDCPLLKKPNPRKKEQQQGTDFRLNTKPAGDDDLDLTWRRVLRSMTGKICTHPSDDVLLNIDRIDGDDPLFPCAVVDLHNEGGCRVEEDVQVKFYFRAENPLEFGRLLARGDFSKKECMAAKYPLVCLFRFTFSTLFVRDDMVLVLKKSELDAAFTGRTRASSLLVPDRFTLCVFFSPTYPSGRHRGHSIASCGVPSHPSSAEHAADGSDHRARRRVRRAQTTSALQRRQHHRRSQQQPCVGDLLSLSDEDRCPSRSAPIPGVARAADNGQHPAASPARATHSGAGGGDAPLRSTPSDDGAAPFVCPVCSQALRLPTRQQIHEHVGACLLSSTRSSAPPCTPLSSPAAFAPWSPYRAPVMGPTPPMHPMPQLTACHASPAPHLLVQTSPMPSPSCIPSPPFKAQSMPAFPSHHDIHRQHVQQFHQPQLLFHHPQPLHHRHASPVPTVPPPSPYPAPYVVVHNLPK